MSLTGAIVVAAVLAVATVVGLAMKARAGRVRTTTSDRTGGWDLAGLVPGPDDRVLLLQLSSPVCTPCRQTARQLTDLATERPGLAHAEIDIAERPETAKTLDVMRTPTTIAFAHDGRELLRVAGVPRRQELLEALDGELADRR